MPGAAEDPAVAKLRASGAGEAALRAFDVDELEALDLRIGTVHAFQGIERDVVVASLGLGPDSAATSWRFVEDPHLFAVFVTRARRRLVLLCSADPPHGGLLQAYLDQAGRPPGRPKGGQAGPWARAIAEELELAGVDVVTGYPSGRHRVDVCVHVPDRSIGIECGLHPAGPAAHIERHLDLDRRGWELLDAYRSGWADRRGQLVVTLVNAIRAGT